ncbi:bifunctional folylpolyglutamate synthase/dihydrofolate synthase [Fimbriiglobus ruber]|uniref:Dihydrofolate synthase/folylpolyglutamate synthase n=1 Tax=Fimbriiglobus ruber TaxID=1908690 RepID=A0A225DSQ5_9BACT|nr:folylpolyglutamate synthase/dihydrofolate synthase family protein [Fimbriiglobus ruber]OWK44462.1 Dihydrofolate synthase [Fimbriiglobus ruber]
MLVGSEMTYDEAIAFWYERINFEVRSAGPGDLKLERMRALLRLVGDPHERFRVVHVTGTKGKGSTCAMVATSLRAAGYRVGLFTSPHLVHVEERMRVNDTPITRDELAARMAQIAPAVRALEAGPWPPPTFFEISTALGFLHFVSRRVDFAVVEVGLGGRFDSTNVCHPLVSVITSIGFDHTAQLGSTLEAIAYQKAGIIKRRVPVVVGVTQPGPRAVIEHVADETGSRMVQLGRDFQYEYKPGPVIDGQEPRGLGAVRVSQEGRDGPTYELGLLGEHQAANAAVAVATLEELRREGVPIPDTAIARGLRDVKWPARIELVCARPVVILDSAHNVPSAEALVATLRQSVPVPGRKVVVFAVSSDKQFADILRLLGGYFDHFYLTRYGNNPRCVAPEQLVSTLQAVAPGRSASVHPTAHEAWHAARSAAGPDDLVCVTGSVFLAGELQDAVRESQPAGR